MANNTNATISVKITAKDEVTPVVKNIEGAVSNLSKTFQGFSTGNLTQSMSGLTGLSQTLQNLGTSMGGIGKSFEGLGGKIGEAGGALKSFASSSAGLAVMLGTGLAVAVGAVGLGLAKMSVDLMQFASSEEKAVAQTKHTLDQMGKSNEFEQTMQNIAKHEASSRFESEELNKAYVQLLTTTKDTAKANEWLALSMDIASKKGLDLYQVSKTLSKVATGEARASTLATLGIDIDEEELEKFKTNSDKAKYLYEQLMNTFQGSYKTERDTGAGALENVTKQIDNVKEALGLALLEGFKPLLESFGATLLNITQSEGFKTFTAGISEMASSFGNLVISSSDLLANILGLSGTEELIGNIGKAFQKVADIVNNIAGFINDMKEAIEGVIAKAKEIMSLTSSMDMDKAGGTYDESTNTIIPNSANQRILDDFGNIDYSAWVSKGTKRVNDALITKSGQVIQFNDNDNILAFQGGLQSSTGGVEVEDINKTLQEQEQITAETNDEMNKFQVLLNHTSARFSNLGAYITSFQQKLNNFSVSGRSGGYSSRSSSSFDGSSCNSGTTGAIVEGGGGSYEVTDIQRGDDGGYHVPTWQEISSSYDYKMQVVDNPNFSGEGWDAEKIYKPVSQKVKDFGATLVDITGQGTDDTMAFREKYGIETSEQTNQAYLNNMHPLQAKLVESYNALVERVEKAGGKVRGISTGSLSFIDTISGTSFDNPEALDAFQEWRNSQYATADGGGKFPNLQTTTTPSQQPTKNINVVFNISEQKDHKELVKMIMMELNRVVRVG
jgi:archaellum component FlaC